MPARPDCSGGCEHGAKFLEHAPAPVPGPDEALAEVHAAAITFAELTWDLSWTTGDGRDRTPVIPSHEVSSVVRGLGANAGGLIGYAFAALGVYLTAQSTLVLAAGYHPRHSTLGIGWSAVTAVVMLALAAGKSSTGRALDNAVLRSEGRVTTIDGILATAVLLGMTLNVLAGWWWADPAAGYTLAFYAAREVHEIFSGSHPDGQ